VISTTLEYELATENLLKAYNINNQGGYAFKLGVCYQSINKPIEALSFYTQCAEIRKSNLGLEDENTADAIKKSILMAKELGKENELPEWIKNSKTI